MFVRALRYFPSGFTVFSILLVVSLGWLLAEVAAAASRPLAGKLIYLQGQVEVRPGGGAAWAPAQINQNLFAGDTVRTGEISRAAILCVDESQLKLNEKTVLILKSAAPSPRLRLGEVTPAALKEEPGSLYEVPRGEIWLRNKSEKFRFEVETPAVTASIRGTEFNLRVAPDGLTRLTLLEGRLRFYNSLGTLDLQPGEEGLAQPGQAPSKRVLVQPADAVQWSLYYPGIFSYRDLPLISSPERSPPKASAAAGLVIKGETLYDQGHLAQARQEAEAALKLDPQNDRALILLGWICLQTNALDKAEAYFRRVRGANDWSVTGLALALYRSGHVAQAYEVMHAARAKIRPTPLFTTMAGYFSLVAGRVKQAQALLEAAVRQAPTLALPRALLAQIYLVQNRRALAQTTAAKALAQNPSSPAAQLTMGLMNIAAFDLPAARRHLEKAIRLDPRFVDAYVYLAKIWLGSDYLDRAWKTIQTALKLAPKEGEVLALAGFIRLAFRDYSRAFMFFNRAVWSNPASGEPHLGLGIYHFRYRDFDQGLAEMLTATLLDPRMSLYQTSLGKALYQVRAFDKALEVYDYAKTLDPKDPSPYLYKGIALTDLNRPAEAVQEINRSIELNDNKAIYRSRLMLDRDRAVSNYNLALAYTELGLGEWAYSKAVTSVKNDPSNSSAQLFLANAFFATRQRIGAGGSALLLYRLLSPANQNTFSQFNDYTPMYEMPYMRALLQGGIGTWPHKQPIQAHSLDVYGGVPGLAFDVAGFYNEDQGFRNQNGDYRNFTFIGYGKWDPTVKNSLFANFSYLDIHKGDDTNLNDYGYLNAPYQRDYSHWRTYEAGYVHRFSPIATLLTYFNYSSHDERRNNNLSGSYGLGGLWGPYSVSPPFPAGWYGYDQGTYNYDYRTWLNRQVPKEFYNFQAQQQLILGDHTFMAGFDYFSGHLKYRYQSWDSITLKDFVYGNNTFIYNNLGVYQGSLQLWAPYTLPYNITFAPIQTLNTYSPPDRSYSIYLLDYWRVRPNLLLELGLFKDYSKNSRLGFPDPIYNNSWNPRVGINYQVNSQHTLRLALQTHVNTHYLTSPSLAPPDVAGFPWQINVDEGGTVREAGFAWEAQWNRKTFSVLRLDAHRISIPLYEVDANLQAHRVQWMWKRYLASFTVNRIMGRYWGLSGGAVIKKIDPNFPGSQDFSDYSGFLQLVFWHPSGFRAYVRPVLIHQDLTDRHDNLFGLLDAMVGYEFPGKTGLASLEISNIFDRHFYYQREFVTLDAFYPSRRILFKLALYF